MKGSHRRLEAVACAVSKTQIIHYLSRGNVDVAIINANLEDGALTGLAGTSKIYASYQRIPVVTLFDAWDYDFDPAGLSRWYHGSFLSIGKEARHAWKCICAVHDGQVWANSVQMQLLLTLCER